MSYTLFTLLLLEGALEPGSSHVHVQQAGEDIPALQHEDKPEVGRLLFLRCLCNPLATTLSISFCKQLLDGSCRAVQTYDTSWTHDADKCAIMAQVVDKEAVHAEAALPGDTTTSQEAGKGSAPALTSLGGPEAASHAPGSHVTCQGPNSVQVSLIRMCVSS